MTDDRPRIAPMTPTTAKAVWSQLDRAVNVMTRDQWRRSHWTKPGEASLTGAKRYARTNPGGHPAYVVNADDSVTRFVVVDGKVRQSTARPN